ncbi:outer membrane protein assembly factor BamB family protein [Flagellimonas crocea]|uniref:outer membrane protein assembly factor BamB family protein n=1 Tax=Flagellimonas crocea TaxID=3067311 RepID=UPI00296E87EB|nr:PQQ-binding-like beta-propeller repeat protein [Muricauda sp. DH64]
MKTEFLVLVIMGLLCTHANAQNGVVVQSELDKKIGKNLGDGTPILAKEYLFEDRVSDFTIDTLSNHIDIQLRGLSKNGKWLNNKGNLLRYDTQTNRVLWSEKVNYQLDKIEQFGGVTLITKSGKTFCLDNATGEELWELKNSIVYVDRTKKVALGYRLSNSNKDSRILEGIDLRNGNVIWERYISREYGWNNIYQLDEEALIIVAGGIHTLNIHDGSGWDYDTKTGKKDYTASAVGTGLGVVAGILTGTYAVATGHDLVRDIASNVLKDSLGLFFASNEQLVRLDLKGGLKWQAKLPEDKTSKSEIFKKGEQLFMVNRGFAFMGNRKLDMGIPFIAAFQSGNGMQKYFTEVGEEKDDNILGTKFNGNELLLLFSNRISRFDLENGTVLENIPFSEVAYGGLIHFIGQQVFIERDDHYISLTETDSSKVHVLSKKNSIIVLNSELQPEGQIESSEFYIEYLKWKDCRFLKRDGTTQVIDDKGRKIAEMGIDGNTRLLGHHLYSVEEDRLLVIDLYQITTSKQ